MGEEQKQFRFERLDSTRHRREEFGCESVELTDFLHKRARKEMDARTSACVVLVHESDPGQIAGYYTLSQAAVATTQLPESLTRKLPRYGELGATLIGRLARDLRWKGQNIGRLLLIDALRRCVRFSAEVGAVVVVTDPKDTKARLFYESFGFRAFDERRLFIPMKELIEREARDWES
jgi:predicted N-acetyltransferase YhbS